MPKTVVHKMPDGRIIKFASQQALEKYIRKMQRMQKRLMQGKTIQNHGGFTIDPIIEKRVKDGTRKTDSKTWRASHIKHTCNRFGKTK